MLIDSKRTELKNRMAERLAEAGEPVPADQIVCVECFAEREGKSGVSGLAGVTAGRIAFVAKDLLEGEVWLDWPKPDIEDLKVADGILGADLVITGSGGSAKLTRLSKEDRKTLEDTLNKLGYLGAPAAEPAPAVVAPVPPVVEPGAPAVQLDSAEPGGNEIGIQFVAEEESVDEREPTPVAAPRPQTRGGLVICPACGKENKPNYRFCLSCGVNMDAAPAAAAPAAAGRSEYPMLIGIRGPEQGKTFQLTSDVVKIGRADNLDITISARDLSRIHAVIEVTTHGCKVTDLGSANGTFVDGRPISSRPLKNGQTIRFGTDHEFLFVEAGAQILHGIGGRGSPASVSTTTDGGAPVQQQKLVLLVAVALMVAIMGAVMFFMLAK